VNRQEGENVIANPNSRLIWEYTNRNEEGNGRIESEPGFHFGMSELAITKDLVIAVDSSGFVHCLDTKTGRLHWWYDALMNILGSPLVVRDKVFVADEDGEVAILRLSPDDVGAKTTDAGENREIAHINVAGSVYASPVFVNGVLYVADQHRLYAIEAGNDSK
jgi:outer membrane protein assembly factor BamB